MLVSALLGTEPPALPPDRLVRVGALFGLRAGTVRTALSRLVASGELRRDRRGWYALGDGLSERQARQRRSRVGAGASWNGAWRQAVVLAGPRPPAERAELRRILVRLRYGELRDGVWMRPDNLEHPSSSPHWELLAARCAWSRCHPDHDDELAPRLWDLPAWSGRAEELRRAIGPLVDALDGGRTAALRPGFELSAAVLRHMLADPLLPPELLPRRWPGDRLRATYERFDVAYRRLLFDYLSAPDPTG